jgi:cytoskeletal protein RodZ
LNIITQCVDEISQEAYDECAHKEEHVGAPSQGDENIWYLKVRNVQALEESVLAYILVLQVSSSTSECSSSDDASEEEDEEEEVDSTKNGTVSSTFEEVTEPATTEAAPLSEVKGPVCAPPAKKRKLDSTTSARVQIDPVKRLRRELDEADAFGPTESSGWTSMDGNSKTATYICWGVWAVAQFFVTFGTLCAIRR